MVTALVNGNEIFRDINGTACFTKVLRTAIFFATFLTFINSYFIGCFYSSRISRVFTVWNRDSRLSLVSVANHNDNNNNNDNNLIEEKNRGIMIQRKKEYLAVIIMVNGLI